MGKQIVMDIVFKAASLNYDQGAGNYQELKKITRWNGKQYTFVSRYALRYSILETGRELKVFNVAEGDELHLAGEGGKKVIQPAPRLLISGEILNYPEFDLFGYLITKPQNFRSAPVKISHAISMTPFNYDALFNANIGMTNRMRKQTGVMKPNPFTVEEHETYYIYSVVVDVDSIGKIDVYLTKDSDNGGLGRVTDIKSENGKLEFSVKKGKDKEESIESAEGITGGYDKGSDNSKIYHITYSTADKRDKIEKLVRVILNLHRSIKGRDENLSPKLLVLGLYKDTPYKSFKDKIALVDESVEETVDEITETTEGDKKIVKVVRKTLKQSKPKFSVSGIGEDHDLNETKILEKVNSFLNSQKQASHSSEKPSCESSICLYRVPEIEVEFPDVKETKNSQ